MTLTYMNLTLQKLDKVINWEIFRPILESELLNKNKGKGGSSPIWQTVDV